jgi:hypothetical protein
VKAEITLHYESEREAEAVVKAVSPDNVRVPSGLFIRTVRRGTAVVTWVSCETKLQTFIATLDDFLSCVAVAERTFAAAKNARKYKST